MSSKKAKRKDKQQTTERQIDRQINRLTDNHKEYFIIQSDGKFFKRYF